MAKNKTKEKNIRNTLWILVGIGVAIFFVIMLLSDVLQTGEKIRSVSDNYGKYLEYAFYGLTAILFCVLIVNPLRIILLSPSFSVVTILDEDSNTNLRVYKKITKNLIDSNYILEEQKKALQSCESAGELREELTKVFQTTITKEINKIILNNAKTVMISTTISQSGKFDMYTVISCNLKMIKEIVSKCGFRPSYPKLGKLSLNVIGTALVAEGLEGLDFNDIFPQTTQNALSEIPFIKPVATSLINGISNALLTIRIGVITRKYLFAEGQLSKSQIRVAAIKESLVMIPKVVKDVIAYFPSKVINAIFKKNKTENTGTTTE